MKIHTTNYQNTFIQIAEDCPVSNGEVPPFKGEAKSIANRQFELVSQNPYRFTSDEVIFQVFVERNDLTQSEYVEARKQFFSKGQACFRASPLTKRYGWGVHSDAEGRIALFGCDTPEYQKMSEDNGLKVVKAMRSGK